jgi:hypothetical protein
LANQLDLFVCFCFFCFFFFFGFALVFFQQTSLFFADQASQIYRQMSKNRFADEGDEPLGIVNSDEGDEDVPNENKEANTQAAMPQHEDRANDDVNHRPTLTMGGITRVRCVCVCMRAFCFVFCSVFVGFDG